MCVKAEGIKEKISPHFVLLSLQTYSSNARQMAKSDFSGSRWRHLAKSLIIRFLDSTKDIQEQFSLLVFSNISLYFPHCICLQETTPCKWAKRSLHCNSFRQYSHMKIEILFEDLNDIFSYSSGRAGWKQRIKKSGFCCLNAKNGKSYFYSWYSFQTVTAPFWKSYQAPKPKSHTRLPIYYSSLLPISSSEIGKTNKHQDRHFIRKWSWNKTFTESLVNK